jgi:hypothetical protein
VKRSTAVLVAGATAAVVGLYCRIRRMELIHMADINDVNAAIDRNDAAQSGALDRVNADVTDLRTTVDELRAQIEAGTDPAETAAALDAIVSRVEASTSRLQGVDPVPDSPAPAPTDEPAPGDQV